LEGMKIFCDNSYRKLFQNFVESDFINKGQLTQFLSAHVSKVAEELHIGRFMTSDGTVLYSDNRGYDIETKKECVFHTGKGEEIGIVIWPVKGHEWTKIEIDNVKLLAETIYLFEYHVRLSDMVSKAEVTDTLTGIPNTSAIYVHAAKLAEQDEISEVHCIFINLKNFKLINKMITHRGGDTVLKLFAKWIVNIASKKNEFAARLGGDNFLMIVQSNRVTEVIEEIKKFETEVMMAEKNIPIVVETRSGFTPICEARGISEAINRSSIALEYAKKGGRSNMEFQLNMMEKTLRDKRISSSFGKAIEMNEFVVYYQPKVDVENQEICGSEALVRWFKDGNLVPPMDFIPVLEREGTICQLDFYVLDMVCRNIRDWIDKGVEPVRVSVNFSKNHLYNTELVEQIINTIKYYEVPPEYIEIELTEMSDYEDYRVMENLVNNIKSEGVATSIDDFGTGYSSLTLLRDLNIDTVKLDRSFVVNLEMDQYKDRVMIESVVNMVKAFGMEVLAEGVETSEQLMYLKSVGCDVIQGYFFDKPMPEEHFVNKLKYERSYA